MGPEDCIAKLDRARQVCFDVLMAWTGMKADVPDEATLRPFAHRAQEPTLETWILEELCSTQAENLRDVWPFAGDLGAQQRAGPIEVAAQ